MRQRMAERFTPPPFAVSFVVISPAAYLMEHILQRVSHFSVVVVLGDALALVIELLAVGQADLDLGAAIAKMNFQGDQGPTLLLYLGMQSRDLMAMHEQLALASAGSWFSRLP